MRKTWMRDILAPAAVVLLLAIPCAGAHGQSDGFFSNGGGYRDGDAAVGEGSWLCLGDNTGGTGSWLCLGDNTSGEASWLGFGDNTGGEASWAGFEDGNPLPTGGGLLLLTLSGLCYGASKRRKSRES